MRICPSFSVYSALAVLACPFAAFAAEEVKDPYEDRLLGSWDGARDTLAAKGIAVTVEYKADVMSNVSGGIKRGANYLDNLDIKLEFDNEKLLGLEGNKAVLWLIDNNGGKPGATRVGTPQGIDNIEVAKNAARLYEVWVEQSFWGGKASLLAGVHDLNTEFMATDVTANFISPEFQTNTTLAQSGANGPSVFPNTALSARLNVNPTEESYIMGGIFDGIANDPNNPYNNRYRFDGGALLIAEAGYTPKAPEGIDGQLTKVALGAWMYTKRADDLVDVDAGGNPVKRRSHGAYLLTSTLLHHDNGKTVTGFFRPGIGDGDTARIDWSYELGLVGGGWVPGRPNGEIGLGMSQAHNGDHYVRSVVAGGATADRNEYAFELYYRDSPYRGIVVQPDVQYIINPGTTPGIDNAMVIGIRVDVNF